MQVECWDVLDDDNTTVVPTFMDVPMELMSIMPVSTMSDMPNGEMQPEVSFIPKHIIEGFCIVI